MPNPLEGLKKAQHIQPAPPAGREGFRNVLNSGVEAIRGLIGAGNDSSASRFGEMAGAAVPMMGAEGKLPKILEDIFAANPAARGTYEKAMLSQMEGLRAERDAQMPEQIGQSWKRMSALMGVDEGDPRPIPSNIGFETAIPIQGLEQAAPQGSAPMAGRRWAATRQVNLTAPGFESKFSVTPEIMADRSARGWPKVPK